MKTKTTYKFLCLAIILVTGAGTSLPASAQTHMTLLCGDNGSQITGTATSLNLTGNVYVYSVGTGSNGAVIEVPVKLGTLTRTFAVENSNAEADLNISGAISGTPGIVKVENGNLKLGGSNLYQDATTVSGGMLQLGTANAVPANPLLLNGGILNSGSPAGMPNYFGYLELIENSSIDLGTGSHTLYFAASNGISWTPGTTITITGWQGGFNGTNGTDGQIFAGTDASGLTESQLDQVRFFNGTDYFRTVILPTGEVVPNADMITTGAIAGSFFCTGASGITVPFTYELASNFSGATFTAQLSDASRSFATPTGLQSVASDASGSQSIIVTIPAGAASGSGYRIRVVSDVPAVNGSDNGSDIVISRPGRKYITVNGSGSENGDDWANAMSGDQLQAAINNPCATEVWVAAGTYYPTVMVGGGNNPTDRHKTFQMRNGVAIYGGFPNAGNPGMADRDFVAYETILSGDLGMNDNYSVSPWTGTGENCYHVFFHPEGKNLNQTAILDGFTIKGGNADSNSEPNYHGGGMYNYGSSPTLNHITFRYNATSSWGGGGAIYMRNSTPVATNITLQFNTSAYGGGIYLQQGCEPSFMNWLITDNSATSYGGGVYNASIYTFIFNNATIANNHATIQGGGIYNAANSIYLRNCILWGNIANIQGNQIFTNPWGNLVKLEYSCFANGPGDIFSSGVPVSWDGNTIQSDPLFVDPLARDYRIKGISPCADAGNNADNTLTTDIRGAGFGRKLLKTNYQQSGTIDMGAYEFNSNTDPLGYYTLSGTLKYNNAAQTPLSGVELTISPAGTNVTSTTDAVGNYSFTGLLPGSHTLQVTAINKPVGYINSTDASSINAWSVTSPHIERVKWMSGDVNYSGGINSTDAKAVQNYFVYFWSFARGEWAFWKAGQMVTSGDMNVEIPVAVTGNMVIPLFGQAVGDFNGSFTPLTKAASATLDLVYNETRQAGPSTEVELPVRLVNAESVGAVSLIMEYPEELFEVTRVTMGTGIGQFDWSAKGGELRAGWNSVNPQWFDSGSVLMTIHGRVSASFGNGDEIRFTLAPDPLNELADGSFNVIPDALLQMEVLAFSTTGTNNNGTMEQLNNLTLLASPNPIKGFSIVDFRLPKDGKVTLEITDMLGRRVALLIDEYRAAGEYSVNLDASPLQPGMYMATLRLETSKGDLVKTIKLVKQQ